MEVAVILVAGALYVDASAREAYLEGCVPVVEQARAATGCLDFALSADLVDPGRINVFERWVSSSDLDAFRGSGPSDDQSSAIRSATVEEFRLGE